MADLTIEDLKAQRRWVLWRLEKRDGKDSQAEDIIKAHPGATIGTLLEVLEAAGCKRGKNWVGERKKRLLTTGVTLKTD